VVLGEVMTELSCKQVLAKLCDWVATGEQFYHTRFGDGELQSAYNMRPGGKNCDGHRFFPDLNWMLYRTIGDVCRAACNPRDNFIVGSNNSTHPDMAWTGRFLQQLKEMGINSETVPWAIGDFWWHAGPVDGGEELMNLCDLLRCQNDVALVCKQAVAGAQYCLGAEHIEIPVIDAWLDRDATISKCLQARKRYYVWAGGMPAKVVAWQVYKTADWPTSHIDVGHLFDGVFGFYSRTWHTAPKPGDGLQHWEYCRNVFNPYVKSFLL
jgi:hypothetical protein